MLPLVIRALRAAAALFLAACSSEEAPPSPLEVNGATQKELAALGYSEWTAPGEAGELERAGVTRHDPGRAFAGLNVFKSHGQRAALLTGMSGETLHTWFGDRSEPDVVSRPSWIEWLDPRSWIRRAGGWKSDKAHSWHWFEVLPNGDLIGLATWDHIVRIDWDSRPLWRTSLAVHHDLDFDSEGRIYTLAEVQGQLTLADGETIPILDEEIVILDPDNGHILARVRLSPFFGSRVERAWVDSNKARRHDAYDVFHANSIEVVKRTVPGVARAGNVLLSVRELDLVVILDLEARRIVWEWGPGDLKRQHHPSFLPNGNLLIFDNRWDENASRVIELDPRRREIVWEYRGDPPESFYSWTRGSSYALPNGNVLVSESNRGRAFEVTRSGDTVWEFWNPDVDDRTEARATLYRFARLPLDHFEPGLLEAPQEGSD